MELMTQSMRRGGILAGFLLLIAGCSGSGSVSGAKPATELAFKGRCVDAKGQGIPAFSLSVGHAGSAQPSTAMVKTTNGQFQTRLTVNMPAAGKVLGSPNDKIAIKVSANGYKSKTFTVMANRVFVGEANTLNVTLEPASP